MDKLVQEYRRRARECVRLARVAPPQHQRAIQHIAETWNKLAREHEHLLETQLTRPEAEPNAEPEKLYK